LSVSEPVQLSRATGLIGFMVARAILLKMIS
jgi:hypothetical protein